MRETSDRLRDRGVHVTGRETGEELATLLEAVERFEQVVESRGGDLMVDEGPHGETLEPDNIQFVLPKRHAGEAVAAYLDRVNDAMLALRRRRPRSA